MDSQYETYAYVKEWLDILSNKSLQKNGSKAAFLKRGLRT